MEIVCSDINFFNFDFQISNIQAKIIHIQRGIIYGEEEARILSEGKSGDNKPV